jgi:hypothetical protein
MLPRTSVEVSGTTMLTLLSFLDRMTYRKGLAPNEVVDQAILAWIAAQQTAHSREPTGQGYRWKNVFLPSGTHLEVRTRGQAWRAHVDGDEIRHEGRSVSPNGFVAACAGAPRNAWREIAVLLPGERCWKPAYMLRREVERAQKMALEAAASAAAAGTTVPLQGRDIEHWWQAPPRERRLVDDRRSPRGCTDFDDH